VPGRLFVCRGADNVLPMKTFDSTFQRCEAPPMEKSLLTTIAIGISFGGATLQSCSSSPNFAACSDSSACGGWATSGIGETDAGHSPEGKAGEAVWPARPLVRAGRERAQPMREPLAQHLTKQEESAWSTAHGASSFLKNCFS